MPNQTAIQQLSQTKINNNAEIANIKKIMGLQSGKTYKSKKDMENSLRYGKILIMTDCFVFLTIRS